MKMRSSVRKCSSSCSFDSFSSSSRFSTSTSWAVFSRSTSDTVISTGRLFLITTIRLAMETSQSVNAYSASASCSALTPLGAFTSISTSSEVKSLMLLTLILPLRDASSMESISESVVVVGGIFVAEAFSSLVQDRIGVRWLGRRFFERAPLHDHYRMRGLADTKIVVRIWIVAGILALCGLATLKIR